MKKILVINSLLLAFSLVLSACTAAAAPTQDPNQLATQVAALVDAQVAAKMAQALAATQAQQAAQPTNTPMIPTIGPIPTLAPVNVPTLSLPGVATGIPCLATPRSEGENYPDGTSFVVNTAFTKKWTISNQGTCTWNANYKLKFVSGDQMGGPAFILFGASVPPWQTITLSLPLKTTSSVGTSTGIWGIYDDKDTYFGRVWVTINRTAFVPTVNNFRVTSVSFAQTGSTCEFKATITAIGSGDAAYTWSSSPDGSTYTNAYSGTQEFTGGTTNYHTITTLPILPAGTKYVRLYIATPNNQNFDSGALTTCS
jgi:hypothetical protein